jgi:hypothetical protein
LRLKGIALTGQSMENTSPTDPAAAFDRDPADGIIATSQPPGSFRYYDIVMAAFVAILLLSNLIGAAKLSTVAGYTFGAGILFFPVSYVIGDVLTEVYGYAKARRAHVHGVYELYRGRHAARR